MFILSTGVAFVVLLTFGLTLSQLKMMDIKVWELHPESYGIVPESYVTQVQKTKKITKMCMIDIQTGVKL